MPGERKFQLFVYGCSDYGTGSNPSRAGGGGVLIKKTWSLTAAHVITLDGTSIPFEKIFVAGGSNNLDDDKMQRRQFPSNNNVFIHPKFVWSEAKWNGYGISFMIYLNGVWCIL